MPATTAVASALLKEVYEKGVRDQLNDEVVALKRIVRSNDNITKDGSARYVTFPIHTRRNNGIGSRREGEDLPIPGYQGTEPVRVRLRYHYSGVQLTGQAMELVTEGAKAFVSQMDFEIERLKVDIAENQNRQVYGFGTGQIATVSTVGANTTATVTSGIQWLSEGMRVNVYTPANLASDSAPVTIAGTTDNLTEILSIVDNGNGTGTITVANSVTWVAGHVLVNYGSANREWTGLQAIVNNTGTLYDVNPATVPVWKSVVDANGGTPRPITENLITRNIDAVRRNGAKTSLLLTTLGVRRAYAALLQQQRQFVNTKEFTGGFAGLGFTTDAGEIPLVADPKGIPGTIFALAEKHIKVYQEKDWSWMNRDGSMWKWVDNKDAYTARMYSYSELGTDRRNAHAVIKDVAEA